MGLKDRVWNSQSKGAMPVADMATAHVLNALRWLRRGEGQFTTAARHAWIALLAGELAYRGAAVWQAVVGRSDHEMAIALVVTVDGEEVEVDAPPPAWRDGFMSRVEFSVNRLAAVADADLAEPPVAHTLAYAVLAGDATAQAALVDELTLRPAGAPRPAPPKPLGAWETLSARQADYVRAALTAMRVARWQVIGILHTHYNYDDFTDDGQRHTPIDSTGAIVANPTTKEVTALCEHFGYDAKGDAWPP